MAMIRMDPVPVSVRTGWFDGRPREITWDRETLPVIGLMAVRDETSAYPASVGPRVVFEVQTPTARLALAYRPRGRRWTVEAVEPAA
jgi:hypothetical protein